VMWTATGNTSGIESVVEMMLTSMAAKIVKQMERDGILPKKGSSYAGRGTDNSPRYQALSRTSFADSGQTTLPAFSPRYRNEGKGFSIEFPNHWTQQKPADDYGVVMALSPPSGASDVFREYVWVGVEEMVMLFSLDQYLQAAVREMPSALDGFQEEGKGPIAVGDTDARWLIYSFRNEGMKLKGLTYILVKGHRAYLVTGIAEEDEFFNYLDTFTEVAESFRLE
jgi:hypothetical protein